MGPSKSAWIHAGSSSSEPRSVCFVPTKLSPGPSSSKPSNVSFFSRPMPFATTLVAVVPEPAQVKELQTQIDHLVRERDAFVSTPARQVGGGEGSATWMGSGPPCVETFHRCHVRSAGSGTLDVRPQLRSPERHGGRRFVIDLEDWRSGVARGWAARDFEVRCFDGRPFEIFSDVIFDRDGRCQKTLRHRRDRRCRWPKSVTIQARYGFRGVRVGEASHPGPPRRRGRGRLRTISTSASFFFDFGHFRLRPISTSANFWMLNF